MPVSPPDPTHLTRHVADVWREDIVPAITEYIAIPALSPAFDPAWDAHGRLGQAVELVRAWCAARPVAGLVVEVVRIPGRTPMLVLEVPANDPALAERTVLLYGHLDKQPETEGWRDGLGPWTPVREGDRLYGRGGADDGYAAFASITAIEALQAAGGSHGRCIVLIEASEESGSPDLEAYVEALASRIGTPDVVLCLDSGCADYDHLWVTTSLRGICTGVLSVELLREGVHSGDAGGLFADSFRVARRLLDRIEDPDTGAITVAEAHGAIPPHRVTEAAATATALGAGWPLDDYPTLDGVTAEAGTAADLLVARSWLPSLAVTGADGLPPTAIAGNVLRPRTALALSMRLAPSADPDAALRAVTARLTDDPPNGARVLFHGEARGGWDAPPLADWLRDALDSAALATFGTEARWMGEGGSIPFIGMLADRFPDAQFVVTGVLGPESNAHGPNEFLHLPTAEKLTAVLAHVIAALH